MAVSTAYSVHYDSSGVPTKAGGRPRTFHPFSDFVPTTTIPTTQLDDAGDVTYLLPVASGRRIVFLLFDATDMDTGGPTLDMDIVLRTTNSAGSHTDTILYNAGTAFGSAAHAGKWVFCDVAVPDSATSTGHIILKVNTAATTPAQGTISLYAQVH